MSRLASLVSAGLLALAVLVPGTAQKSRAATIEPYDDPYLRCVVRLSGIIEKGDAERLNTVLEDVARQGGYQGLSVLDYKVYQNSPARVFNENLWRVCLDSPGGSFAEALKISVLISEFLGTAIPRGATCLSACAIVFMSGARYTESDAGIVANRVLHAGSRLGFHAPSLTVPNADYTEAEVNKAYKIAVAGIGQLMARSGDIKMSHTLIAQMLQTAPEDNFSIDTVFDAGRWLIDVVGAVRPETIDKRAISNACNSHYNWEGDRISTNGFGFNPDPEVRYGNNEAKLVRQGNTVSAEMDGFGQEGTLVCRITIETDAGADDAAGFYGDYYGNISMGEDGIGTGLSSALLFDPRTKITDLVRARDDVVETVPPDRFALSVIKKRTGRCQVFKGNKRIDDEPCGETAETNTLPDLSVRTVTTYLWPSGTRTVLVDEGSNLTINGASGDRKWSDLPVANADCTLNSASGNLFCFVGG